MIILNKIGIYENIASLQTHSCREKKQRLGNSDSMEEYMSYSENGKSIVDYQIKSNQIKFYLKSAMYI